MKSARTRFLLGAVSFVLILATLTGCSGMSLHTHPRADVTSAATALFDEETVTLVYERVSPAVMEIKVEQSGADWYGAPRQGQGSGFLIDKEGHILTNNHVVEGATSVEVVLDEKTTLDGEVVGQDPSNDLALVKVDASKVSHITPVTLGDSDSVQPGQLAIALGCPFGLEDSITVGVISGLDRSITSKTRRSITGLIQTDAAINPGNSGGPLLNSQGEVIGINTAIAIEDPATGANGIGFAIPINTAKQVLPELKRGEEITRPWLGISGTAITEKLAETLNLPVDRGVYVITVVPDSPAAKAGIQGSGTDPAGQPREGGDIITAMDGHQVASVEDLIQYFNRKKAEDKVTLTIIRDHQSLEVSVILGVWPENLETQELPRQLPTPERPNSPWHYGPWHWWLPPWER